MTTDDALLDYTAMTLAELLNTGSVAADLRAKDVITQAEFLHRSDIVVAALMVVRLEVDLKAAREHLAALLPPIAPPEQSAESDGDEPGRSYHAHLTATGAAEPDDTRRAGGDV